MNTIYKQVLDKYGITSQRWVLIEEMGEVLQAMSHRYRGRTKDNTQIKKELVDLQTVLNTVIIYYFSKNEWDLEMVKNLEKMPKYCKD